jgi:hypothetical protein
VPTRERKLLAHKRELANWDRKVREKGVTLVPLALYFKGSRVKVTVALARGKKLYDKRAKKREQEDKRAMERAMSGGGRGGASRRHGRRSLKPAVVGEGSSLSLSSLVVSVAPCSGSAPARSTGCCPRDRRSLAW